jgi:serine/threonine protein kinase
MAGMTIGKFSVVSTLGTGAHSTILQIRRNADFKNYALKVVKIDGEEEMKFLDQARHEFRIAQMLNHPNLIKIYALETSRDWLFRIRKAQLLIEYVEGKTLDTFPRFPIAKLVQIFERVAAGLVHMHRRNVCHSDLKPLNIMLSNRGQVKIIDYGLARIKGEGKGRVQGTPEYMAPEQAKHARVNEATDIYNLGATMYRLVAWRLPPNAIKEAESGLPLDAKLWRRAIKPVEECNKEAPPALCELIHRCLAFHPSERPDRVSEVQGALDHLADELVRSPEDKLEATE